LEDYLGSGNNVLELLWLPINPSYYSYFTPEVMALLYGNFHEKPYIGTGIMGRLAGYWELIRAAIDIPWLRGIFTNHRDTRALFCSELVGEILVQVGLMSENTITNELVPEDFLH
jgi:hypothetical protein